MKDFIVTYWPELVIIVLSIISVVVSLIFKKNSSSTEKVKIIISDLLPGFINLAEASGVCGQAKLMFVIESIMKRIKCYVSSKDEQYWFAYIRECVENILSTPQKKGTDL